MFLTPATLHSRVRLQDKTYKPAELSLEDAARLQEKRAQKAAEHRPGAGRRTELAHRAAPDRGSLRIGMCEAPRPLEGLPREK